MTSTTSSVLASGTIDAEANKLLLESCLWVREHGGTYSIKTAYTEGQWMRVYVINWPEGKK